MPRITKKMKLEELINKEEKINTLVLQCMGFGVDAITNNIIDQSGQRLIYNGKSELRKFLKWGNEPLRRRELKFDVVNDYQLAVNLFNTFIEKELREAKEDEEDIQVGPISFNYVRTICLKDGTPIGDKPTKSVEIDVVTGKLLSEEYIHPTLAYIELMFGISGLLQFNEELLRRVDDLKNEME